MVQPRDALPDALKARPSNRYEWDFPTAWLLGTNLIGALSDIAISFVFDFDPRDWMTPGEPIALDDPKLREDDGSLWIDFLADTGDSPRLVYQLAYLLQQQTLAVTVQNDEGYFQLKEPLPRGRALIVGGDTSYPISSRRRLLERVRAPFIWAQQDLADKQQLSNQEVLLFGIPGNHDYYNALAGFERQFHDRANCDNVVISERVDLPGYKVVQRASYFAAVLPYGWQFWALDCEKRGVDAIQRAYFERASKRPDYKQKLFVAMSRPAVVNHAINEIAKPKQDRDDTLDKCFAAVNLPCTFAEHGLLPSDQARIDLSGDVHLYERYWGTDARTELGATAKRPDYIQRAFPPVDEWPPRGKRAPTGNERMPHTAASPRANYASVVSGLGGAFHHPSQVRGKPDHERAIVPRRAWPGGGESDKEIGQRLLRPRKLFQAGAVGVIGMVIAALTYATRSGHLLDVPFDIHGCMRPLMQFFSVGSVIMTVLVLCGLTGLAVWLAKKVHAQVRELGPPRNPWGRVTCWLTHNAVSAWVLRWAGVNRRNAWSSLIVSLVWIPILLIWFFSIRALTRCSYIANANVDHFLSTYVTLIVLVVFMAALGAWRMGHRNGVLGAIAGLVLGVLTAALVVWTPYAWARLATSPHALWVFVFPGYWVIRHFFLGPSFLTMDTTPRRIWSIIAYLVVVAFYTLFPALLLHNRVQHDAIPLWGLALAILLSAFLSCLWLGWYFFLCLQFNAHGNEAGSAARVVSFAEFLRIKITEDRAEVFVIGVEGPAAPHRKWWQPCSLRGTPEEPPIARLIDHFVVGVDSDATDQDATTRSKEGG